MRGSSKALGILSLQQERRGRRPPHTWSTKRSWSSEKGEVYPLDQQENDCQSAAYQPAKVWYDRASRDRHQVKLQRDELVRRERRIGRVGNQFQECAPAGIAHDSHISPRSFWLHVNQVPSLGSSDEGRIGRVTQPKPHQTLFIACVRLFGRSLELRRAGKRLQLRKEMDEIEHVDWLSIIGLSPWAEAGNERLNSFLGQRQLFDNRQVSIDLRLSELTRSLGMPGRE